MNSFFIALFATAVMLTASASETGDRNNNEARRLTREAEYNQRKADEYRADAKKALDRAESYLKESIYYTRRGNVDNAKSYNRRAEREMDNYKLKKRYADDYDRKASDYLRRARNAMR